MKTSEVLIKAKSMIVDCANWTQGTFARKADKSIAYWYDPEATCFCTLGAVMHASISAYSQQCKNAKDFLRQALPEGQFSIHDFNDSMLHAEVLQLFDDAISLATKKED